MKKLFLAAGVAMSVLMASCGGSTGAPKNFDDSISVAMGEYYGKGLNQQFAQLPAEEAARYSKAEMIRGIKEVILNADTADMSYLTGLQIAMGQVQMILNLEQSGIKVDRNAFLSELAKCFNADSVADFDATQARFNELMTQAQGRIMAAQQAKSERAQAAAQAAAEEAMANNKKYIDDLKAKDPEIKTTASGLSYKVIKQGNGATPAPNDKVDVIYTGTLIDGTEFDSSKGNAIQFSPGETVAGFSEGLQMMNPGSEYILYIPSELGYGPRPTGKIPANSMLIFNVKVTGVTPAN